MATVLFILWTIWTFPCNAEPNRKPGFQDILEKSSSNFLYLDASKGHASICQWLSRLRIT